MSKKAICVFTVILSVCCLTLCIFALSGCEGDGLLDYAKTDFGFLQFFDYGKSKRAEAVAVFDNVEQLARSSNENLTEGAYVATKGYYDASDMGGASYVLRSVGGSGSVLLKNGLFANIVSDKCVIADSEFYVVNVKQFGAKADGITADQAAINSAAQYVKGIEGQKILYLPKGEYRADNEVQINDISDAVITGAGNDTVIFTDNGYKSWWEFFFACWRDENCFFGNFKIEARECWGQNRYFRQLTLVDCRNCYLYNLHLNVPQTAWTGEPFERVDSKGQVVETASIDKQYTNLTIYSGDKNITVDSCVMYQMSGTYRGANIGVMDFYQRGTENITIKNCELHDNARDEQVGIFSLSSKQDSFIDGVNFVNNKVFTYPTPYRDVVGARTMCFTVAYANNDVRNVNINDNEFVSYADSKFMTFGSVKNCAVKNNKITVLANHGNGGYVFDSSCPNDDDVVIDGNEFYLTYATTPAEGKCISAGRIIFKNNRVVADCTVYKIADRLGIYENNVFDMLGSFGSCGSAVKFNYNTVTSYGEHSNQYNELFFNHSGDSTFNEDTVIEFIGNTVTDYTYYHGAKNQKVFDKLGAINNVNIKELRVTDNIYNCPNYSYTSSDYMWICWVRSEAKITNFVCENNDLQGANVVYGAECGNNTLREFNSEAVLPQNESINILVEEENRSDRVMLTASNAQKVAWFTLNKDADVHDGVVTGRGKITVFAAKTDGSGVYAKTTVDLTPQEKTDAIAIVCIVLAAVIAVAASIAVTVVLLKRKRAADANL